MTEKSEMTDKGTPNIAERAKDPGFWREMWQQAQLVLRLLRDPEVPIYLKLLPAAALLYVVFPLDFAPDFYPILGQLDDITAILVGAKVFIEMAPPHVVARHLDALGAGSGRDSVEQSLKESIVVDAEHEMVGKE